MLKTFAKEVSKKQETFVASFFYNTFKSNPSVLNPRAVYGYNVWKNGHNISFVKFS